ncbi:putative paraoxonase [Xylaria nigripes]|nr:putative paraoxonase [Xylaria nigripes]
MAFRATLSVILLALLVPYLYERSHAIGLFWKNSPEQLTKVNAFVSYEIKFTDRIRSCEDVLLVESAGIAILACDPGRERWNTVMGIFLPEPVDSGKLYIYNYKDTDASDDDALKELTFVDFEFQSTFHTLGMAYNESTSTLLVASHRPDYPAIEMFRLDLEAYTATYLRSIQHPLIHGPNSIVLVNDHEFYVTNDHHFLIRDSHIPNRLETYLGIPGGSAVHVDMTPTLKDPSAPVNATVVARVPFANGIELLNETTAVIASSTGTKVNIYNITKAADGSAAPTFKYVSTIRVNFAPDNLSVSKDGTLFIAGHPHFPTLVQFSNTRHICNAPDELAKASAEMQETCRTLAAPSWVMKWTEAGGAETVYTDSEYPSSATAARDSDRRMGIIAGLYAKGIFVWRD